MRAASAPKTTGNRCSRASLVSGSRPTYDNGSRKNRSRNAFSKRVRSAAQFRRRRASALVVETDGRGRLVPVLVKRASVIPAWRSTPGLRPRADVHHPDVHGPTAITCLAGVFVSPAHRAHPRGECGKDMAWPWLSWWSTTSRDVASAAAVLTPFAAPRAVVTNTTAVRV